MGAQWKHAGKTENAATKGRVLGKLAKEIIVAAKSGADLEGNSRLRQAVDRAKAASMPRDTIERAIKKGAGLLDETINYETVVYEGFGPHHVPVIVECLTDNKHRTASNIRLLFRRGQLGSEGSVAWDFKHQGVIEATPPAGADPETAAIEAGAQDLEPGENGQTRFFTEKADLDAVSKALSGAGWTVNHSALGWKAKNPVKVDPSHRAEVDKFLGDLDEDDDVQNIFVGLEA
jgi:YebC/PmpR family DNA-binding regulatory protein